MREPEELASAPDYRWRRWWNQFWIHCCIAVFVVTALVTQEFVVIPAIVTGLFYWFAGRKAAEWDAAERGFASPAFDDVMKSVLERERLSDAGGETTSASGVPVTAQKESAPIPAPRAASARFGRAKPPPKKPVDLPRRRR